MIRALIQMISVPGGELRAHSKEPRAPIKKIRTPGSGLCHWVYGLRAWGK